MGFAGLSLGHILVVLLVVILVFGTKKLGNIGSDLGSAIKGFRKAMASSDDQESAADDSSAPNMNETASPQAPTKRADSGSSGASRQ